MTIQEVQNRVKNALVSIADIFECSPAYLHSKQAEETSYEGKKYITFYYPKKVPLDAFDGFKLVGEKGYISIKEKYLIGAGRKLERVSYVYRYITDEFNYSCSHNSSHTTQDFSYKFHYDMDLENNNTENHPQVHLQVLHNHPRFKMDKDISVIEFLEKIRMTCFQDITGKLTPYTEPIFLLK